MTVVGNILWMIFGGGIIFFLYYVLAGVILCLTIIGIPFGIQCIKLSILALMPFGREIVPTETPMGGLAIVMNIIWILIAGFELALTHIILVIFFAITIIGIPFAIQHAKLIMLSLLPFGHETKSFN